jgi:SAM-dependent methyltransferase
MDLNSLRKLNLGCGRFKKEGYVNLDRCDDLHPDVLHDLSVFPYPFPDDRFDLVEADHVIEHLNDPFGAMKELHRIVKDGGIIILKVPHFSRGFTHPEHKRGFDVSFPYYFDPSFKGGYTGTKFECVKTKFRWFAQPYLKKTVLWAPFYYIGLAFGWAADILANLSPFFCSRFWCFLAGGFEEIEFHFVCRK